MPRMRNIQSRYLRESPGRLYQPIQTERRVRFVAPTASAASDSMGLMVEPGG